MCLLAEDPLVGLFFGASLVGAVIVVMVGGYYGARLIADSVRRGHAATLEAQTRENQDRLKSLMIQRGMSADEIERVLQVEGSKVDFLGEAENTEAHIVEVLSENGYEATDIERILVAARIGDAIPPSAGKLVVTMAENWAKAADIERILQTRRKPATA